MLQCAVLKSSVNQWHRACWGATAAAQLQWQPCSTVHAWLLITIPSKAPNNQIKL
jgi:hypothetical protein